MKSKHMAIPFALTAAAVLAGDSQPVTAGWEDICKGREEVRVPKEKLLWQADLSSAGAFKVTRRNGAEGQVVFRNGRVGIRKTNAVGEIVVEGPSFPLASNAVIRLIADVHVKSAEPYRSQGLLRALTTGDGMGVDPRFWGEDFGNARNVRSGLLEQPAGMCARKWCHYVGTGTDVRPVIIIAGAPSTSTWRNWEAEDIRDSDAVFKEERARSNERRPPPEPLMASAEEVARQCAASVDHTAQIRTENGIPCLFIDGRKAPAAAFHATYHHSDSSEMTAGQPITRGGVPLTLAWPCGPLSHFRDLRSWTEERPFDARKYADEFREMMRGDTNALYLVGFDCNVPTNFIRELHPNEGWIDAKGQPVGDVWPSMASPAWRETIKSNIRSFVAELKRTGHARKLVGIHFIGYEDGQFNMSKPDFSPCAKRAYDAYLRANPGVSTNYWQFCRQLGVLAQAEFAKTFKSAMGKDVIAVRWDSAPFVVDFAHGTMNRDPDGIDVCVTQPTYADRAPAHPDAPYVPWSSLALHNKMHWYEMDLRTGWMNVEVSQSGQLSLCSSPDDAHWGATYRKLAGEMLATRSGFWFFDMGRGWFAGPGIAADIVDSMKTMRHLTEKRPSPWRSNVAVVVDEEGLFGVEGGPDFSWPSHLYCICERQLSYMAGAGVPYDFYLAEDVMADPRLLKDKKVVVFIFWRHFDARRQAAIRALFRRGQTHVFLSESGCLGGAKEATGFDIDYDARGDGTFVLRPEPGFKENVVGAFECEMQRAWLVPPERKEPFYEASGRRVEIRPTPGTTVWARYADEKGAVAIAERRDPEARRWYLAVPGGLTPEIFLRIVREAGAYAPLDRPGLTVNMNGDFVSVHALQGGRYDFRLPFACEAVNVKSGKAEPTAGGVLRLNVTPGETCWFLLN